MATETVHLVQAYVAGKGRSKFRAEQAVGCKTAEEARRKAERLAPIREGVVAFAASADIELAVGTQAVNVQVATDPIGVAVDSTESKVQTNITANLIESLPKFPGLVSLLRISPSTRPEPL